MPSMHETVCAACVLCLGVSGQEILWQREGVVDVLWMGGTSVFLGDVDGDGREDLAHAVTAVAGYVKETQVLILSGRDGSTFRTLRPPAPNYGNIYLTGAGDMDRDGIGDYAVTVYTYKPPWGPNRVQVRSGRDDRLIWEVSGPFAEEFGFFVAGDLDLDGDRKPDLLVGAPREAMSGAVHAYDNTGQSLHTIPMGPFGWGPIGHMGSMGDLDGDGCDDFVVGAWEPATLGAPLVFSGRTGRLLVMGAGQQQGDGLGSGHNTGCGDVDGDGVLDFVSTSNGGFGTRGSARVFSGQTGQTIYAWRHPVGSSFGSTLAAGDLDRDAVADLLVGPVFCATAIQTPALDWHSLRDGSKITEICRPPPASAWQTSFGSSVAIGAPHPGDPFPTFVVSDPRWGAATVFPGTGRLTMFRAAPTGVSGLGPSCRGTLPAAPQLGLTARSASTRLHLSGAPSGALAFLLLGVSSTTWAGAGLPLSLEPLGFSGCSLYTSVEVPVAKRTGVTGLEAGYAFFDLPVPVGGTLGVSLHGQWLVAGSGPTLPGALSDAISWRH